jgi:hypothetical protein
MAKSRVRRYDSPAAAAFAGQGSRITKIAGENPMNTRLFVLCLGAGLWLAACGDNAPSSSSPPAAAPTRLSGHVSNDDGPVLKARIEAADAKGSVVARAELPGGANSYQLTLPAGTAFPVILTAYAEAAPNAPLKAAVPSALAVEQDISPVSTIVVDTALSLGGIDEANLAKAAGAAIALRKKSGGGGGATTESFKGDPTKQYGGWH